MLKWRNLYDIFDQMDNDIHEMSKSIRDLRADLKKELPSDELDNLKLGRDYTINIGEILCKVNGIMAKNTRLSSDICSQLNQLYETFWQVKDADNIPLSSEESIRNVDGLNERETNRPETSSKQRVHPPESTSISPVQESKRAVEEDPPLNQGKRLRIDDELATLSSSFGDQSMDSESESRGPSIANIDSSHLTNPEAPLEQSGDRGKESQTETQSEAVEESSEIFKIGGKYPIIKLEVDIGLNTSNNDIRKYFRHLIRKGWKSEEKAFHNLAGGGSSGNKEVDQAKLKAYIDYCITSWNENQTNLNSKDVIPKNFIEKTQADLRTLMSKICREETQKKRRSENKRTADSQKR